MSITFDFFLFYKMTTEQKDITISYRLNDEFFTTTATDFYTNFMKNDITLTRDKSKDEFLLHPLRLTHHDDIDEMNLETYAIRRTKGEDIRLAALTKYHNIRNKQILNEMDVAIKALGCSYSCFRPTIMNGDGKPKNCWGNIYTLDGERIESKYAKAYDEDELIRGVYDLNRTVFHGISFIPSYETGTHKIGCIDIDCHNSHDNIIPGRIIMLIEKLKNTLDYLVYENKTNHGLHIFFKWNDADFKHHQFTKSHLFLTNDIELFTPTPAFTKHAIRLQAYDENDYAVYKCLSCDMIEYDDLCGWSELSKLLQLEDIDWNAIDPPKKTFTYYPITHPENIPDTLIDNLVDMSLEYLDTLTSSELGNKIHAHRGSKERQNLSLYRRVFDTLNRDITKTKLYNSLTEKATNYVNNTISDEEPSADYVICFIKHLIFHYPKPDELDEAELETLSKEQKDDKIKEYTKQMKEYKTVIDNAWKLYDFIQYDIMKNINLFEDTDYTVEEFNTKMTKSCIHNTERLRALVSCVLKNESNATYTIKRLYNGKIIYDILTLQGMRSFFSTNKFNEYDPKSRHTYQRDATYYIQNGDYTEYFQHANITDIMKDERKNIFGIFKEPPIVPDGDALAEAFIHMLRNRVQPLYQDAFMNMVYSHAFKIQQPNSHITRFYILYSQHGGTGKTLISHMWDWVYGERFTQQGITLPQLTGDQMNAWMSNCLHIGIDEVESPARSVKEDGENLSIILKRLTNETIATRNFYELVKTKKMNAIIDLTTNKENLNGLINGDNALFQRMVIIKMKEDTLTGEQWDELLKPFSVDSQNKEKQDNEERLGAALYHYLKLLKLPQDFTPWRYQRDEALQNDIYKQRVKSASEYTQWIRDMMPSRNAHAKNERLLCIVHNDELNEYEITEHHEDGEWHLNVWSSSIIDKQITFSLKKVRMYFDKMKKANNMKCGFDAFEETLRRHGFTKSEQLKRWTIPINAFAILHTNDDDESDDDESNDSYATSPIISSFLSLESVN